MSKVVFVSKKQGGLGAPVLTEGDGVMKTDSELKADLMERLDAIPAVNASNIEIDVDHGMVTLSGHVDTHQTKSQVERTARRVHGIRGLEVNVKPLQTGSKKHHV